MVLADIWFHFILVISVLYRSSEEISTLVIEKAYL